MIPGVPAWGAKSVAALLSKFGHIEDIAEEPEGWGMTPGRARRLAQNLADHREGAFLYRRLATLRTDVPLNENLADLAWRGASDQFRALSEELGFGNLSGRIPKWA